MPNLLAPKLKLRRSNSTSEKKAVSFNSNVEVSETYEKYTNYFSEYDRSRCRTKAPVSEKEIQKIKDEVEGCLIELFPEGHRFGDREEYSTGSIGRVLYTVAVSKHLQQKLQDERNAKKDAKKDKISIPAISQIEKNTEARKEKTKKINEANQTHRIISNSFDLTDMDQDGKLVKIEIPGQSSTKQIKFEKDVVTNSPPCRQDFLAKQKKRAASLPCIDDIESFHKGLFSISHQDLIHMTFKDYRSVDALICLH